MVSLYDVTVPLTAGMPVWPGEPGPVLTSLERIAAGDPANVTRLSLGSHTGTHVDAPRHFIDGTATVEALPLETLCGPSRVVRVDDDVSVQRRHLEPHAGVDRILLQTRNGGLWEKGGFQKDFVYLDPDAADWLVEHRVRLIGIDYLSIEQFHSLDYRTHHTLLAAGIIIVEGLDLRRIVPGDYNLWCLPLKVVGADGAPCRVVLTRPNAKD
jgi:arylformamidase